MIINREKQTKKTNDGILYIFHGKLNYFVRNDHTLFRLGSPDRAPLNMV